MGLEYITEPQIFLSHITTEKGITSLSAVSITNNGDGPALKVNQNTNQPVAAFQDDGNTVLFIDGRSTSPRRVGINTETPNVDLTVVGDISASGTIYGTGTLNGNSLFLYNPTGDTRIEVGGSNDVYIDFKVPNTDDYDLRIGTNATDSYVKTAGAQPLIFQTGNIGIGVSSPNEEFTVGGSISATESVYGFFVPRSAQVPIVQATRSLTLPSGCNDIEILGGAVLVNDIITTFFNGIPGVTYTLTNLNTFYVTISSSATTVVRDGLGLNWEDHSCISTSTKVQLLQHASCSVRIGSTGIASVW